ncbi:MAG: DNA-3-methyladenine glycosylase [Planctomycetia bacterium]|nr:DNA-3-methyladenine glycosylase [Planctomycetia bacterium]
MPPQAHPRRLCPLPTDFFDRRADTVARELLGARLVVRGADGRLWRHVVFETEAYLGAHDRACHGSKGITPRNATMFGPAGRWYVYLCYGMHWMLNIVTGAEGAPAAVLIRSVGEHIGPGRVTKALGIDRSFDGRPASRAVGLWFEPREGRVPPRLIERTPRIGVGYAGEWAEKPLRFVVDPARLPTITSQGRPQP